MKKENYWFWIEPYVYLSMIDNKALLYNTLDKNLIESNDRDVISLLNKTIDRNNGGVAYLGKEMLQKKSIVQFIELLRKYYMGDIMDAKFSNSKPIQLLPYCDLNYDRGIYKKQNFSPYSDILNKLLEIKFHLKSLSESEKFLPILEAIPENICLVFSIQEKGDISDNFLKFLDRYKSMKDFSFSYINIPKINFNEISNIRIKITMEFPINKSIWMESKLIIENLHCDIEYIIDVRSEEEYDYFETFFYENHIDKYQIRPKYTGENMDFFKKCVFLDKEDILSSDLSIKDIIANQAINIYDFGKINIFENGDVYANIHHPKLGNIFEDTIYELVQKEVDEGCSWFRIRDQYPCNKCLYQWLCPSPSDYEILLNRPNLCNICTEKQHV